MRGIRTLQAENARDLLLAIEKCETEADIEIMDDIASEQVQLGLLTKKAYKGIEEAMDDRILTLVEEGKI